MYCTLIYFRIIVPFASSVFVYGMKSFAPSVFRELLDDNIYLVSTLLWDIPGWDDDWRRRGTRKLLNQWFVSRAIRNFQK